MDFRLKLNPFHFLFKAIIYMRKYCLVFLFTVVFQGCSTVQHMVPGRPLRKNEVECRFSVGMSTNNYNVLSLQFAAFKGLTDNDAMGFTFSNLFVPSSFSYVRYWSKGDYNWNYQFHINDLWGSDFNPEYETDIAVTRLNENSFHSLKAGVGFYTTPVVPYLLGKHAGKTAFVPVIGYQFRNLALRIEAEVIPGMAKYFAERYKSPAYLYSDADSLNKFEYHWNMKRIYRHDEIKEIKQIGEDYSTAAWKIALANGDTVLLENRDPYADCYGCEIEKRHLEAYKDSEDTRVLWIYYDEHKMYNTIMAPTLIEVNMKKAISDFNSGLDLILLSDKDLIKNTLNNINPVTEDFFFSIGHDWSGN